MSSKIALHPDRLFPTHDDTRNIARRLYQHVKNLPIISPHGHTDPAWFAENLPFENAVDLLITPDHYVFRMLYSQGIPLSSLGIQREYNAGIETDKQKIWQTFAEHYYLFSGTPTRLWLDSVFFEIFGLEESLNAHTAKHYFETINRALAQDDFRPRALFEKFNIAFLATTESPLDDLSHHRKMRQSNWQGRVVTAYRPDPVVDPDYEHFHSNIEKMAELTGEDTTSWSGYLNAHRNRREFFKEMGATSTDHGHPSAVTADLSFRESEILYQKILSHDYNAQEAELFRAQMLTEMAAMSLDDGLVMQIHPGSFRNHNVPLYKLYGRDKGADIPVTTEYVKALRPLLNKYGNNSHLTLIVFTLDETNYARELAPLAGHYPALKLGPPWWFHDSPEGMKRFRQQTTETAGFYNTVGFNDDTRAFLSIPARHDVARRMDCHFLAEWVADHRLGEDEAAEIAVDLTVNLVKHAYRID